jgi:hypothetical protein
VPTTPQNLAYIQRQKEHFLKGLAGPDFPQITNESTFKNVAKEDDIKGELNRVAMGFVGPEPGPVKVKSTASFGLSKIKVKIPGWPFNR